MIKPCVITHCPFDGNVLKPCVEILEYQVWELEEYVCPGCGSRWKPDGEHVPPPEDPRYPPGYEVWQ